MSILLCVRQHCTSGPSGNNLLFIAVGIKNTYLVSVFSLDNYEQFGEYSNATHCVRGDAINNIIMSADDLPLTQLSNANYSTFSKKSVNGKIFK